MKEITKQDLEFVMDTFENASPPHEQTEKVVAKCWECGEMKLCFEHIVCVVLELTSILVQRVERLLRVKSKKTNLCVMIRAYRKPRLIVLAFLFFILETFQVSIYFVSYNSVHNRTRLGVQTNTSVHNRTRLGWVNT